jgi:CAAX protease family protein
MNAAIEAPVASPRFRLKLIPLLVTAALGYGVASAGAYLAHGAIWLFHLDIQPGYTVGWVYLQHSGQCLVGLAAIAALKYTLVPADYGLHLPRGKTYIWPAILWGIFFGVLMTAVDYAPDLIAHTRPDVGFELTRANIWSWLSFEGLYVGPTEEIPFRALLVTYLATTMPGKLRVGRFEMNWAGVLVAVIFALLHANSFDTRNWTAALGQQVYAFALGVLYAYWLEKSRSILAPMIGHNVSDVVEQSLVFLWIAA